MVAKNSALTSSLIALVTGPKSSADRKRCKVDQAADGRGD